MKIKLKGGWELKGVGMELGYMVGVVYYGIRLVG